MMSIFKHFPGYFGRRPSIFQWEIGALRWSILKTILAVLFSTFGLPLRFLPSKVSFLHDHFTTQHSDFSSFLAVSTTDKPVNRSIHSRSSSNLGYKIQKTCGRKIYSRLCTFDAEVHISNIQVKRWHNKFENSELD